MTDNRFHTSTLKLIERARSTAPQALLLTGEPGIGLELIAAEIARGKLLTLLEPHDIAGKPLSTGTISVESIRQLYERTKSKHTHVQFVIVHSADRMSNGAQNAFLKLLEEPGPHIRFILTSYAPQKLLSTVLSRAQRHNIRPTDDAQTSAHITLLTNDDRKRAQLQFIARGLPDELSKLATDERYFAQRASDMTVARSFLQGSAYDKLQIIQSIKSDREKAMQLTRDCIRILRYTLQQAPSEKAIQQLDSLVIIQESIARNYHVGLQLSRFVL